QSRLPREPCACPPFKGSIPVAGPRNTQPCDGVSVAAIAELGPARAQAGGGLNCRGPWLRGHSCGESVPSVEVGSYELRRSVPQGTTALRPKTSPCRGEQCRQPWSSARAGEMMLTQGLRWPRCYVAYCVFALSHYRGLRPARSGSELEESAAEWP